MTERDPGTTDVGPADDAAPTADEPLDEEFDGTEPEDEFETEPDDEEREARPRGEGRSAVGWLGAGRLLGRGRAAHPEEPSGRVGMSVRATHPESRVHINDRPSAIYAVVAAASLIGVLLYSLTFAPGGFLSPKVTLAPIPSVVASPAVVPQSGAPSPTPGPSSSGSTTPSSSPSTAPSPSAS